MSRNISELEQIALARLRHVEDPEIRVPITDLGMVSAVTASVDDTSGQAPASEEVPAHHLRAEILLTTPGCPMQDTLRDQVFNALVALPGVSSVEVALRPMDNTQRRKLVDSLRSRHSSSLTAASAGDPHQPLVLTVASGKGGVGKSTVTANLATALSKCGYRVGLIDADIHGFSIPRLLSITTRPTRLEEMILPPVAYGVKTISIGMFLDTDQPVAWRGPMLHRALEQFIGDVHWGQLDVLLVDLPPGTGDIAISVAQLLPQAQLLVVTTPQYAATHIAARAGELATKTHQAVAGVIENMGPMTLPDGTVMDVFGAGGGKQVAQHLAEHLHDPVELLGTIPLDPILRTDADQGQPTIISHPDSPSGRSLQIISERLVETAQIGSPMMS
ncbi:Mrp/NBP35 family ATP-binding protein [Auritidibacter ignavus]|uniref:Mrp/NBP35 family ATP-binding protein n=1 Tax=Auritidibacter ignavus TaxID=678932 RepID=UPI00109D2C4C|nr:P-loop NTPase [Auritidibacter ignavus]